MFKNTFQSGFLSILYSIGSKPLQIWDKKVRNGHIKRITDNDIQSLVLEILGSNVSTTYITCPADPRKTLGIKLPFLVMIIKNLKKYFTFEVQVRVFIYILNNLWENLFINYCLIFFYKNVKKNYLHVTDNRWQKCTSSISCQQLPVHYKGETIYLYYANETGWWMESDTV